MPKRRKTAARSRKKKKAGAPRSLRKTVRAPVRAGGAARGVSEAAPGPLRTMTFDQASNSYVVRDAQSSVRAVLHTQKPVTIAAPAPLDAAENYLRTHAQQWGFASSQLGNLRLRPLSDPENVDVEYRLASEKQQFDLTTVTFQQTCLGLPVWGAAISVQLKQKPDSFDVTAMQTTRHETLTRAGLMPTEARLRRIKSVDELTLARQLGVDRVSRFDPGSLRIRHQNLMVYRYDAKNRDRTQVASKRDALPLPPVPPDVADGSYNLVAAVYFDLKRKDRPSTHWVALVEARTLAVLYLEEFAAHVNGSVFVADPVTTNGGPAPGGSNAKLNARRVLKPLANLHRSNPQKLAGDNVRVVDFELPDNHVPTEPAQTDFVFDARGDEFAAVNAYFHCDRFFGCMHDLGFDRARYFPAQQFPITVDPRGTPNSGDADSVAAECRGTTTPAGPGGSPQGVVDNVIFCLADPVNTAAPIGLAADWRVALHELGGHGTLMNHINSTFFDFCHSVGDSLAAILNDPESKAAQKGRTFPWVFLDIPRRHDRKVKDGWGWDGPMDRNDGVHQLNREQILSTSHFRLYQAIGGGNKADLAVRQFAARFASYLILRAVQTLTPGTNPKHAADWLAALLAADACDWTSEGQVGGAYAKVISWAFEKQNLFGGAPPDVDVLIDDGRKGEYTYKADFAKCPAIWNRHAADGHAGHQAPVPNVPNFAYVAIKNRGTKPARSVVVNAFQGRPQSKLTYPDDWQPMTTAQLPAPDLPPKSAAVKVGPFQWTPAPGGGNAILMAVSAAGDVSNLGKFSAGRSIPDWRLVPNDNNLGLRKV